MLISKFAVLRYCLAAVLGSLLFILPGHEAAATITTVTAGPDTDAANNDYRRIQNALNAAVSGDTIILSGTFDFTAPFAAAAWALGNDGIAATADDYEVLVPANLNNVILTAASLGSATIQGPNDLAAVDLEAFLVFDRFTFAGVNQGWTISNLRVLDFDLSIAMFAGGASDFNGTTIQNNFIRIPTDLNATVAPADVIQNIGIHFSFGTNQSILGNTIQIPGDGVSDSGAGNFSTSVGMQSNTSGGATYDGLLIANNIIHVLNAQSANPQVILGIWENGHAHTSNINITNNSFINDAVGNNPALNLQRAFRVTSHSSITTTVTYNQNHVGGANIGFQWIAGADFTGNQSVRLIDNLITNSDTGVLVQSNGLAHLETNEITFSGAGGGIHVSSGQLAGSGLSSTFGAFQNFVSGGSGDGILIDATAGAITPIIQNNLGGNAGFGLHNLTAPTITAQNNWWGNNLAANVAAKVSGPADFDNWLASGTDVSPATVGFQPFIFATTSGTITTFVGTAGADTGALLAGSPLTTMMMNGQTATTATAQLLNFNIQLGASDDIFTLGQTGIPTIFDGGTGNNTLAGTDVAQTWNITGAGSGNIPSATSAFSNVQNLRAGTAADSFVFGAAGSITGTLDGNLGIDTLNNSAIPASTITPSGPGTLDGFKGTATGIGLGFDNINLVAASPADLVVTKTGPATATTGTVISYTITVTNNGPNPALNAQLTDPLPAGTTFSSIVAAAGWLCATPAVNAAGTVTCTRASVPMGANVFTLNVNAPTTPGGITNTATVTSANEGALGNESGSQSTTIIGIADLVITKTGPANTSTGAQLVYIISVHNNGPAAATNVVVTDVLPAFVTFNSATPSQGSCSGTATVTCSLGTIASGSTATITLVVTVTATSGSIDNTATVAATEVDPTPANTTSTTTAAVGAQVAPAAIPTTGGWALLALALMLGLLALARLPIREVRDGGESAGANS